MSMQVVQQIHAGISLPCRDDRVESTNTRMCRDPEMLNVWEGRIMLNTRQPILLRSLICHKEQEGTHKDDTVRIRQRLDCLIHIRLRDLSFNLVV